MTCPFIGIPVAAAGLETRSGDYSNLRTAQGARQIAGHTVQGAGTAQGAKAAGDSARRQGGRGQRKVPAGEQDSARCQQVNRTAQGARRRGTAQGAS
eukprot:3903750-Pleurochrysis_carterae.AAC.1